MAIKGNLDDIRLSSVIQMLCLESRRMVLRLHNRTGEGQILTENGEILHAAIGGRQGENALREILSSSEGSFSAEPTSEVAPKTIGKTWARVGVEEVAGKPRERPAEAPAEAGRSVGDTQAQIELDRVLSEDLLALLAQAERSVDRVRGRKVQKQPAIALTILEELVNQVIAFSERIPQADLAAGSLIKALARANDRHPQVRLVHASNNRVSLQTARNLYRNWGDDRADRSHMFRQIGRGLVVVLETYFALLAGYFGSREVAEEWSETYHVFLLDLIRALESVKF